jgi:hypothetical protein
MRWAGDRRQLSPAADMPLRRVRAAVGQCTKSLRDSPLRGDLRRAQ